ncbi:helix-turn-helix domain-containing protein [Acinetobacter haemolyticus]|uniref:helix-turn-helix domain-containing protein n=1 Tax=Acinetobacter haemolyticus TaxID=29430 RepID=UPI0021CD9EF0|nr:helix-turn-helix transcriptional regulator [Acinetobacter haemolyticus]MCU4380039.1 helix-turn-helix domain-containing protein [Acinetobacter haemolyticus]
MSIGENIKKICIDLGINGSDLAKQANLPKRTVHSIMNDEGDPRASNIKKIVIALGVSADTVLFDDEEIGTDGDLKILFRELSRLKGESREYAKNVLKAIIIQQKNKELN